MGQQALKVRLPKEAVAAAHLRQHGGIKTEPAAELRIPGEGPQIEQLGAGGVGVVCGEHPAAGELVHQPGVDGAGAQVFSREARVVLQQPGPFRRGKVGGQVQTCPLLNGFGFVRQPLADVRGTGALPHHCVCHGQARIPVPEEGRLPLIADAHRPDGSPVSAGLLQQQADGFQGVAVDLQGVVGHPALAAHLLLVGQVLTAQELSFPVKEQGLGARGALVNGKHGIHASTSRAAFAMPWASSP